MIWILVENTSNYSYTTDFIQLSLILLVFLGAIIGVLKIIRKTLIRVEETGRTRARGYKSCDGQCSRCDDLRYTSLRGSEVPFCERSGELI